MQINIKYRASILTFMLIVSSLSFLIIPSDNIKADNGNNFEELLLLMYGLHPYVTAGWYEYYGNESLKIEGDIKFNLFFSSTLSTQTRWKDDIEISLYSVNSSIGFPVKIENANTTTTLEHEFLGETVQSCNVTIEDFNYDLNDGEILLFTVEIIQSDKPIGNIIKKRYQDKLQERAEKVADFLNKSGNENLEAFGGIIMQILGQAEEFGVTPEEFANLGDSFSSASFVYNSKDYPSSVKLPISSNETLTLYYHNNLFNVNTTSESPVSLLEQSPNGSAVTWPTRLFSMDPYEPEINSEEWLTWFVSWLAYIQLNVVPPEEEDKSLITYYLTGENTLSLDSPVGDQSDRFTLSTDAEEWGNIPFSRNMIIENATAELFIYYPKIIILRKITVEATLYDGDEPISTVQQKMDRTNILELLSRGPDSPTIFTFVDAEGMEIEHDHDLKIAISAKSEPLIYLLRNTKLLCDSETHPSSIILKLSETDNIKIMNDLEDIDVIPGGSAKFTLNIKSKFEEKNIRIDVTPEDSSDLNDFTIEYPNSISIKENGKAQIHVFVNSTNNITSAYDTDKIDLYFNVTGKTGFDSEKADVDVSDDAVDYYADIKIPKDKEIKHGTSGTYKFKIKNKNTGFWDDVYEIEAFSDNDWDVEIENDEVEVKHEEETEFTIKVFVPDFSEVCHDVLEINITSKESVIHDKESVWTVRVITTVVGPNAFEHAYNYFESVSEGIGLEEFLGDFAAAFLIFIVIFIILLFLIPIIYLLRKKYVEIICLERIKEIDTDEKGEFEINLRNPTKTKQTYEVNAEEVNSSSKGWEVSVDTNTLDISPKQTRAIDLSVKPTDYVKKDDWAEIKIVVKPLDKKKKAELSTVTSIKPSKPDLKILGTFSWPNVFKKGDKVTTIFRINNVGKVSANNISVILYVNGEEKNKVEDITIPRRGYAEIEIPWIAVKGKNEVNIVVK
jgi:hypothetical protein